MHVSCTSCRLPAIHFAGCIPDARMSALHKPPEHGARAALSGCVLTTPGETSPPLSSAAEPQPRAVGWLDGTASSEQASQPPLCQVQGPSPRLPTAGRGMGQQTHTDGIIFFFSSLSPYPSLLWGLPRVSVCEICSNVDLNLHSAAETHLVTRIATVFVRRP